MATAKLSVTLPIEQVQEIRTLVSTGQAENASAFMQHAISIALSDAAEWREMLQEALVQTGGPLTEKEIAWADSVLSPSRTSSQARRNRIRRREE